MKFVEHDTAHLPMISLPVAICILNQNLEASRDHQGVQLRCFSSQFIAGVSCYYTDIAYIQKNASQWYR